MDNVKINIDTLSTTAKALLTPFAFYNSSPVQNVLVQQFEPSFSSDPISFAEIVQNELVDGASLLEHTETEGDCTFQMHCLLS